MKRSLPLSGYHSAFSEETVDMADKELAGKVALVTGASRNIGRAIALQLAAGGAAVAVNARNAKEDADKVVQEVKQAGGQAETFMADIVDPKAVNAMVEGVVKKFGRLDRSEEHTSELQSRRDLVCR